MKYTIYQITNTINNKIYIGKHQTENIHDDYFGSGIALKRAIQKYGKSNFVKEILYVFDTEQEMNQKEKELITEEFVKREDTYNLGVGGEGGPHFKGRVHTEASRRKMGRPGQIVSQETRQKLSEANKRRKISEETKTKISIKRHLEHGKTYEEARILAEARHHKPNVKRSNSQALKAFYENPENRLKKADQMRKLHQEYDLESIKHDYDIGLTPSQIMQKYGMTKNRYDHIRAYYLKRKN